MITPKQAEIVLIQKSVRFDFEIYALGDHRGKIQRVTIKGEEYWKWETTCDDESGGVFGGDFDREDAISRMFSQMYESTGLKEPSLVEEFVQSWIR